ncbi:MAG: NeuD/PglB/VioB family sugar acetyltransferase [Myxococcota bacterium]
MGAPIVILGTGGFSRVVAEACSSAGRSVAGFLGPEADGASAAYLGGDERLDEPSFVGEHEFVVAIGDQRIRAQLCRRLAGLGGRLATIVDPSATVAPSARLGPGSVVIAGAAVGTGSIIGGWVIVNINATVDHDARLDDGVHICPGATLAGDVTCGEGAFVGTGASVMRGIEIGANAIIGAGAAVIRNVAPGATAVGVPAREVKRA